MNIPEVRRKQDHWLRLLVEAVPAAKDRLRVSHWKADTWHFWPCTRAGAEHQGTYWTRSILPSEVVFDLDLSDWAVVVDASQKLQTALDALGFPYLLAFTGGKSCHVHVFLESSVDMWSEDELKEFSERAVDIWKWIRECFVDLVLERADLKSPAIGLDWGKINWSIKSKGSMIRDFGTPRDDGRFKTLLLSGVPNERPSAADPMFAADPVFPDTVPIAKVWTSDFGVHLHRRVQAKFKEFVQRESKEHEAFSELPDQSPLEYPCIKERLVVGAPEGFRYNWAQAIALALHDNGQTDDDVRTAVQKFVDRCDPDDKTSSYPNDALRYAKSCLVAGRHFSCAYVSAELDACSPKRKKDCPRWNAIIGKTRTDGYREPAAYFEVDAVKKRSGQEFLTYKFLWGAFAKDLMACEKFRRVVPRGDILYYWRDGIYLPKGEQFIVRRLAEVLAGYAVHVSRNTRLELVDSIRAQSIHMDEPEDDSDLIPFKNGVYNWIDGTFRPFDIESDIFYSKLVHDYAPEKKDWTPIKDYFEQIFPAIFQEMLPRLFAAYILRETVKDANATLIGDKDSGKTTFLLLLRRIIGQGNISTVPIQAISYQSRFGAINIRDKLVNIYDDLESKKEIQSGMFKAATGGSPIHGERKGRDMEEFKPYAKHVYCTNEPPYVDDLTGAYDIRMAQIEMPFHFVDDPQNEFERLKNPDALAAIGQDAIEAFLAMVVTLIPGVREKGVGSPLDIEQTMITRLRTSNPLGAFALEACNRTGATFKNDFHDDLLFYCAVTDLDPAKLTKSFVTRKLPLLARGVYETRSMSAPRQWDGIEVKAEYRRKERVDPLPLDHRKEGTPGAQPPVACVSPLTLADFL